MEVQQQQQQPAATAGHIAKVQTEIGGSSRSSSSELLVSEPLSKSSQLRLNAARALLRCCWGAVLHVLSPPQ